MQNSITRVENIFTNVLVQETIKIMIENVYNPLSAI